ncbi:MAG: lactonase family protein [Methyloligellaceae bacterium]
MRFQWRSVVASLACILAVTMTVPALAQMSTFYVISNKAKANTVVAFGADATGNYTKLGEYGTGGKGTGDLEIPALKKDPTHPLANGDDPLISANALAATDDKSHVLAVNPGDGTVALLKVKPDMSLALVSTAPASDKFPVSIAVHGSSVVVASVGKDNSSGSLSAFKLEGGKLVAVKGSRRDLKARPSTADFSTDGRHVIVNELVSGKIHAFAHDGTTLSKAPVSTVNSPLGDGRFQAIPVGFAIKPAGDSDIVLMSEARFLTPDFKLRAGNGEVRQSPKYSWQTSSLSTYRLYDTGQLALVTRDALTGRTKEGGEIANCWVALSKDGSALWTANALSSSISAFSITADGIAKLKNVRAFKLEPANLFFGDMAISANGKELFQLIGNKGQVLILDIGDDHTLTPKQFVTGLPQLGSYGLLVL